MSPVVRVTGFLAVVFLAVSVAWSTTRREEVGVLVATRTLPALHVLTEGDFRVDTDRPGSGGKFAALPVSGRVIVREVKEDKPVREDDVGPDLEATLGSAPAIVGVPATRAAVLGGTLKPGDAVRLLVGRQGRREASVDAVVVSVSRDKDAGPRPWALVVGMREKYAERYAYRIGRSGAVVVRATGRTDG